MATIVEVPGHGQVEFPDGMSDADIAAAIKKNMVVGDHKGGSKLSRLAQGAKDPFNAGAQLLTHILPQGVVDAGNKANNWLADKTSLVAKVPEGGIDQMVAENESQYQADKQAAGVKGFDWMRLLGNVASPANLAVASRVPQAASVLGRIGAGAGAGAIGGALSPVTEGNFATEKAKQVGIGAAGGALMSGIGEGVSRIVKPNVRPGVQELLDEGITPTPGQILGGVAQTAEDKMSSVPILGDAITSARKKGVNELNTAVYKRVLDPIGGKVPKDVGREAVANVADQISGAYDNLLPKVTFKADAKFSQDIAKLQQMAASLPDDQANRFEKVLRETVIKKFGPKGTMDGTALKGLESELGELATGLRRDALYDNRQLGNAIGEIQTALRENLIRTNPAQAGELKAINKAFANFARLREAAGRIGAEEGEFTAPQLQSAVRALDKSKGKGAFAKGQALLQDLSDPAKAILPEKYPNSGTAGRAMAGLLTMGAAGGGAAVAPAVGLPVVGAGLLSTLPYLPGGRQAIAAILARRPEAAQKVADVIRKAGPLLAPAGASLLKPVEQ